MIEWLKSFWRRDERIQTVDAFQLESLIQQQVRFTLYDLRSKASPVASSRLERILAVSVPGRFEEIESALSAESADRFQPVVLLCEKGRTSTRLASRLLDKNMVNVYIVEDGLQGLIRSL